MQDHEYAGFWVRLAASLIDVILGLIVILIPLILIYGNDYLLDETAVKGFWDVFFNYFFPIVITVWFWLRYMATPGKMVMKLKVVDAKTGNKLSVGQAIGRYFAYIPAMLPLGLGLIWVGIDKKKQGWHDKLAGTVVIRSNQSEPVRFE